MYFSSLSCSPLLPPGALLMGGKEEHSIILPLKVSALMSLGAMG